MAQQGYRAGTYTSPSARAAHAAYTARQAAPAPSAPSAPSNGRGGAAPTTVSQAYVSRQYVTPTGTVRTSDPSYVPPAGSVEVSLQQYQQIAQAVQAGEKTAVAAERAGVAIAPAPAIEKPGYKPGTYTSPEALSAHLTYVAKTGKAEDIIKAVRAAKASGYDIKEHELLRSMGEIGAIQKVKEELRKPSKYEERIDMPRGITPPPVWTTFKPSPQEKPKITTMFAMPGVAEQFFIRAAKIQKEKTVEQLEYERATFAPTWYQKGYEWISKKTPLPDYTVPTEPPISKGLIQKTSEAIGFTYGIKKKRFIGKQIIAEKEYVGTIAKEAEAKTLLGMEALATARFAAFETAKGRPLTAQEVEDLNKELQTEAQERYKKELKLAGIPTTAGEAYSPAIQAGILTYWKTRGIEPGGKEELYMTSSLTKGIPIAKKFFEINIALARLKEPKSLEFQKIIEERVKKQFEVSPLVKIERERFIKAGKKEGLVKYEKGLEESAKFWGEAGYFLGAGKHYLMAGLVARPETVTEMAFTGATMAWWGPRIATGLAAKALAGSKLATGGVTAYKVAGPTLGVLYAKSIKEQIESQPSKAMKYKEAGMQMVDIFGLYAGGKIGFDYPIFGGSGLQYQTKYNIIETARKIGKTEPAVKEVMLDILKLEKQARKAPLAKAGEIQWEMVKGEKEVKAFFAETLPEERGIIIGTTAETAYVESMGSKLKGKEIKWTLKKGDIGHIEFEPIYKSGDYIKLYHGVSSEKYNQIIKEGLKLGKPSPYQKGFTEPFISLTLDKWVAEAYAGTKGKVVEVIISKSKFKELWGDKIFQDPFSMGQGQRNIASSINIKKEWIGKGTNKKISSSKLSQLFQKKLAQDIDKNVFFPRITAHLKARQARTRGFYVEEFTPQEGLLFGKIPRIDIMSAKSLRVWTTEAAKIKGVEPTVISFHTMSYYKGSPFQMRPTKTPSGIRVVGLTEQLGRKWEGYMKGRTKDKPHLYPLTEELSKRFEKDFKTTFLFRAQRKAAYEMTVKQLGFSLRAGRITNIAQPGTLAKWLGVKPIRPERIRTRERIAVRAKQRLMVGIKAKETITPRMRRTIRITPEKVPERFVRQPSIYRTTPYKITPMKVKAYDYISKPSRYKYKPTTYPYKPDRYKPSEYSYKPYEYKPYRYKPHDYIYYKDKPYKEPTYDPKYKYDKYPYEYKPYDYYKYDKYPYEYKPTPYFPPPSTGLPLTFPPLYGRRVRGKPRKYAYEPSMYAAAEIIFGRGTKAPSPKEMQGIMSIRPIFASPTLRRSLEAYKQLGRRI